MSYNSEKILLENEDMIVGQLGGLGRPHSDNLVSFERARARPSHHPHKMRKKQRRDKSGYSEVEDWTVRSLDLLSPFDTDFISEHLRGRSKSEIEYRLNDPQFRLGAAEFKKVPLFIFELIFLRDRVVAHKCLMLLTTKQIIPLPCRSSQCQHDFTIPRAQLSFTSKSPYGFEVKDLCDFISSNVKQEHFPYLRRNVYTMEDQLTAAQLDYRNVMPGGNPGVVAVTKDSLRRSSVDAAPVRIDAGGRVVLAPEHEATLRHIVKAIGKNKWAEATQLLLAVYDSEIDFDAEDVEIYKRVAGYFRHKLDVDQRAGPMTEAEARCGLYLHRAWHASMAGPGLWQHIARHLASRTAPQVQARLARAATSPTDLTLDNAADPSSAAGELYHAAHSVSLTIFPKDSSGLVEVTTKLQHEVRFVVAGTRAELFMLPCKYTAIRCTHLGMEQNKFTYDPERPAQQFEQYLKLTFANSLKKAGLVADTFEFSSIRYSGPDIHTLMRAAEQERFVLPKEDFMRLNRRQVAATLAPSAPAPPPPSAPPPAAAQRGRGRGRGRPSAAPAPPPAKLLSPGQTPGKKRKECNN